MPLIHVGASEGPHPKIMLSLGSIPAIVILTY